MQISIYQISDCHKLETENWDDMIYRIFVEKKPDYAVEAGHVLADAKTALRLEGLKSVRLINRYDVEGLSEADFKLALPIVFSEPAVDVIYSELPELSATEKIFAVEYLPGQFDQRADSCEQCIQLLTQGERCKVKNARVYIIDGDVSDAEFEKLKAYLINPVESCEASLEKVDTLKTVYNIPTEVAVLDDNGVLVVTPEVLLDEKVLLLNCSVFKTAFKTSNNFFVKASPFASITLSGFVTKSIAPNSKARIVTSASFVVMVLTIITVAFIFSFCKRSKSSRPFIRGILISSTTPSYLFFFNFSYASSPSRHTSVA